MASNNPFEHHHHHHDHEHDHDHAVALDDLDPAQRSLAEALQVSFRILQYVMVVLLILYALSGIFTVEQREAAVRLWFGKIVGEPGKQIVEAGGPYFALPYPLMEVVKVPVAPTELSIYKQFWFDTGDADAGKITDEIASARQGPLNPEKDGSLLTGDANILHARWSVTYRVADPVSYVTHVGDPKLATDLVRVAAEEGIVLASASLPVDELINGLSESEKKLFVTRVQAALDDLESGIEVTNLSLSNPTVPLSVREAYRAVINAETERAQQVEQAEQERARILGSTAGEAYRGLWNLVEEYEKARLASDGPAASEIETRMDEALVDLKLAEVDGGLVVGGQVAQMINEAKTYRTQVVEQVRSDALAFEQLLPLWRQNPRIVESRIWLTAKEQILTGQIETLYMPKGQIYLELNRDPAVRRQIEEAKLKQEQERQRQEQAAAAAAAGGGH